MDSAEIKDEKTREIVKRIEDNGGKALIIDLLTESKTLAYCITSQSYSTAYQTMAHAFMMVEGEKSEAGQNLIGAIFKGVENTLKKEFNSSIDAIDKFEATHLKGDESSLKDLGASGMELVNALGRLSGVAMCLADRYGYLLGKNLSDHEVDHVVVKSIDIDAEETSRILKDMVDHDTDVEVCEVDLNDGDDHMKSIMKEMAPFNKDDGNTVN